MGSCQNLLCCSRWDIGYLMALTPFDEGRDGQTGTRAHFCWWVVALERTFQGPGQDGPPLPSLLGRSRGAALGWTRISPFVCLFVCLPKRWATHRSTSSRLWGSGYLWTGAVLPRKWDVTWAPRGFISWFCSLVAPPLHLSALTAAFSGKLQCKYFANTPSEWVQLGGLCHYCTPGSPYIPIDALGQTSVWVGTIYNEHRVSFFFFLKPYII